MNKDVIIVGCGPSGITAAIYLKRAGFNPILIEKGMPGGKIALTHKVNNYPGFSSILGSDFAEKLLEQLSQNNIAISFDEIIDIHKEDDTFFAKGRYNNYSSKAVILASGTLERKMNIPGEKEFFGYGVSNCAVCDGQFFKGKPMAIVGGNSKALEEALYLSSITDRVYVINRRDSFDAEDILINKVMEDEHIKVLHNTLPIEIKGDKKVSSLVIENIDTHTQNTLMLNAVFAYVGVDSNMNFVRNKEIFNDKGFIVTDENMETSVQGLFACGDCRDKKLRQIVTATSDGAIAAISVVNYLKNVLE